MNFSAGDTVLLIDRKKRRYLVELAEGGEFHSHAGFVAHDTIIGSADACNVKSTRGASFLAIRPTLSDYILKMPRGAQVIYPKDLGPILMLADIFPGAKVLESGLGSGALSMTLLRAGADITGYEIREDFAAKAQHNVVAMLGAGVVDRYGVEVRDVYDGIDGTGFDRVVLDLPEPWNVVKHAAGALRPGGILLSYTPSVMQVAQLRTSLEAHGFVLAETVEILQRSWYVEGQAVRPDHRMVAHTAFLTHARLASTPE